MTRQLLWLLTARPVNNDRAHPVHTAHGSREFEWSQNIAHGITIQTIVAVSALWLARGDDATPVLSRQLVASYPAGEAPAQNAIQPLFEQRRTTVGIKRMLEHNHVMLTQQFLLVWNIDKEIWVVRVEIVHRHVTEL